MRPERSGKRGPDGPPASAGVRPKGPKRGADGGRGELFAKTILPAVGAGPAAMRVGSPVRNVGVVPYAVRDLTVMRTAER
ncbi:hypothetical protein Acsp06_07290 [Actinomycetospora sp. NBRC 106375]|nr:hypothetical protein Acsp06_07290 [Actinomycetospora sp. NBRC 106375]